MFREMRCSRAENHFALPILEKGQSLIIMIPQSLFRVAERENDPAEITAL